LRAVVKRFTIDYTDTKELSTPNVSADSVLVYWAPKIDSLRVSLLDKPFEMYDSIMTNTGTLTLFKKKLTGSGDLFFETAELVSDSYNFYTNYFEGHKLDFDLRENSDSPFEFGIVNAYGKVELDKRKGYFLLSEDDASVEFIANKYEAFIDNIVWNIDEKTIDLKSTNAEISPCSMLDNLHFCAK